MSEPIAKHQMFEYENNNPFQIINLEGPLICEENLLNHWHTELEMAYIFRGHSEHYIDGSCIHADPGDLVVVNSESIHSIIPDRTVCQSWGMIAVVLIISFDFVKECFPDLDCHYFVVSDKLNLNEVRRIMVTLCEKAKCPCNHEEVLLIKGLILELFYYLCQDGYRIKDHVMNINRQKNNERLRGIIQHVERHYMEPITQSDTARRFYFTKEYFSRFFKKNTGVNFKEYLTNYRILKARNELIHTDHSILEIALNNGFSDERRLIESFKKIYQITPLQYRKKNFFH
jgi:AraC-like DNA-binding protein